MTTLYFVDADIRGTGMPFRPFSDNVQNFEMTAATDLTITIPAGIQAIIITANGDVWVRNGAEPVIPTTSTPANNESLLNPVALRVDPADVIHFKSAGTPVVSVELFAAGII